jgi:hypothetical protein
MIVVVKGSTHTGNVAIIVLVHYGCHGRLTLPPARASRLRSPLSSHKGAIRYIPSLEKKKSRVVFRGLETEESS